MATTNYNCFSFIYFYERRVRRILPALFFVMLTCIPFAWMWMLPDPLENFGQSIVATTIFSNNILLRKTAIDTVYAVCIALIAVFTFKNIALYIKNITLSIIQFKLIRDLRNRLYGHLHYLSLSYFNKRYCIINKKY